MFVLTGQPINSAFSRFYGSMDIIPFLGKNFNLVFPLFTIFLALLQVNHITNHAALPLSCTSRWGPLTPGGSKRVLRSVCCGRYAQGLNVFNRLLRYFRLGMLQFGDAHVEKKDLDEVRPPYYQRPGASKLIGPYHSSPGGQSV